MNAPGNQTLSMRWESREETNEQSFTMRDLYVENFCTYLGTPLISNFFLDFMTST